MRVRTHTLIKRKIKGNRDRTFQLKCHCDLGSIPRGGFSRRLHSKNHMLRKGKKRLINYYHLVAQKKNKVYIIFFISTKCTLYTLSSPNANKANAIKKKGQCHHILRLVWYGMVQHENVIIVMVRSRKRLVKGWGRRYVLRPRVKESVRCGRLLELGSVGVSLSSPFPLPCSSIYLHSSLFTLF